MPGGRPRKPDSLKAMQGTLQKCRTNPNAPKVDPGMPEIPTGLVGYAKRKYVELCKELAQMKVITPHDSHLLEHVSKEFALIKDLEKIIKKDGYFYHGNKVEKEVSETGGKILKETTITTRIKTHPALTARNQAWANIMRGLQECGLTPSTRSKLKVVQKEDSNPFAKFMTGTK